MADEDSERISGNSITSPAAAPLQWRSILKLWRQKSMRRLSTFPAVGVSKGIPALPWRRGAKDSSKNVSNCNDELDFCLFKPSWKSFSISELQIATNYFNSGRPVVVQSTLDLLD